MSVRYGLDHDTWVQAKREILTVLRETARHRTLITYGSVTEQLLAVHAHPGSYVFTAMLRETCHDEARETGVILCALVVSKATGKPGGGYYQGMACASGDLDECWQREREAAYSYYSESVIT